LADSFNLCKDKELMGEQGNFGAHKKALSYWTKDRNQRWAYKE
jgi:hypothetical protein